LLFTLIFQKICCLEPIDAISLSRFGMFQHPFDFLLNYETENWSRF